MTTDQLITTATLETLKRALQQEAATAERLPLTDEQYRAGFNLFRNGSRRKTYRDFIIPQLSILLEPLINARSRISVLEIGPGPESILCHLPDRQRTKIRSYTGFEPNPLLVSSLEEQLANESLLPNLNGPPCIRPSWFEATTGADAVLDDKYDLILFCHSMYGMTPKRAYIEKALGMLVDDKLPGDGLVVVFHQEGVHFDGLVCHKTVSFPTGTVSVPNNDTAVDSFALFAAGWTVKDQVREVEVARNKICRSLGRSEGQSLVFSAPEVMVAFTRHATSLPELFSQVPFLGPDSTRKIKNSEARLQTPAAVVKPTEISHIQTCVRWAIDHKVGLTVIGGSHSGHCVVPNVVAIDMSSFNEVNFATTEDGVDLIVAEAGANAGQIVSRATAAGLTVPLGSRPSVGAGLWLQGGIGHLARMHGLTCDSIVGAVLVKADSGEIVHVGSVPAHFQPAGSSQPRADLERDILWAMKGAGTNFGVVVRVVFKTYAAPTFLVRTWKFPLTENPTAMENVEGFNELLAGKLAQSCSVDAYLYQDGDEISLEVQIYQVSTGTKDHIFPFNQPISSISGAQLRRLTDTYPLDEKSSNRIKRLLGPEAEMKVADCRGLFETDSYMSGMHGGHGGGKTSSFKRCVFLKDTVSPLAEHAARRAFTDAMFSRPTPLCYVHFLHAGGKGPVKEVRADAAAFGCRGWSFACVVSGVWLCDQHGSDVSREVQQWVHDVVGSLIALEFCSGVYPADLGPDPRDAALALEAFGPNRPRLARLKKTLDPHNIMAYACPLPKEPMDPRLIILVTGQHMVGKDYGAKRWASVFRAEIEEVTPRWVSISKPIKKEYADSVGASLNRLLKNREYKEQHRPALTTFWEAKVRDRPFVAEEQFLSCVYSAAANGVDVLLITGMRDEAPAANFSHLVPDSKVVEVQVRVREATMRHRRWSLLGVPVDRPLDGMPTSLNHVPDFFFDNDVFGEEHAQSFALQNLVPLVRARYDLRRLEGMVRAIPDFPRPGVEFRHVLGITSRPDGIALCTDSFKLSFGVDWDNVDAVVSCEAGGFLFASALANQVDKPLVMVRKAGKLPPPVVSVAKGMSHISDAGSVLPGDAQEDSERVEIERDAIPKPGDASVVVVDDVLASGKTLCAVLSLLRRVGVEAERISVMVVAEFPVHRGRKVLLDAGFGQVKVQSLLVFGGV